MKANWFHSRWRKRQKCKLKCHSKGSAVLVLEMRKRQLLCFITRSRWLCNKSPACLLSRSPLFHSRRACVSLCVSVHQDRRRNFRHIYYRRPGFLRFFVREWCAVEGISVQIKFPSAEVSQTPIFCQCWKRKMCRRLKLAWKTDWKFHSFVIWSSKENLVRKKYHYCYVDYGV